ncbi:G patch domain-containing protein 4 isoform X2 [Procambarus clarkii]|uniref:G patch domain-containing protein 4 isoform X2 n=1 Tax=Procambarus clarkii TaxID=6728 RepID=UPI001E674C23|nr:G patch domain-containing protein 4-like isoform X1 [Procambarus clarkii]
MANSGQQFAEAQLKKYGWKEGKGLGREERGMTSALKPKLKFDNAGLGHDIAKDFKFHWWDHVFNKAAENISVDKSPDGSVQLTKKEELHVSKKKPSRIDHKATFYGGFVKGGTLVGAKEERDCSESEESEEERDMSLRLTDEELFKICGGRTAHKGARHGLTMTAKLARVEEQERILMQKWSTPAEQLPEEPCEAETLEKKQRKKKRQHLDVKELNKTNIEDEGPHNSIKDLKNGKTSNKRRKIQRKDNTMDSLLECVQNTSSGDKCSEHTLMLNIEQTNFHGSEISYKSKEKKRKKDKKNIASFSNGVNEITDNGVENTGETNNTEKENCIEEKENSCTETAEQEEENIIKKKKDKKRKKHKHVEESATQQTDYGVTDTPLKKKKKKKKEKK